MEVRTTRFGVIEIAEDRVITFPGGMLGFGDKKEYCLLQPGDDACFFWLQCVQDPDLAFVVTDPTFFEQDYSVPIRPEQMQTLGLDRLEDAQVFPVRGLVQVPCIERNGLGAIKAVSAASLSMRGDGTHLVPLDAAIETMRQTGVDMSEKYKETALGGLAVNVPNC